MVSLCVIIHLILFHLGSDHGFSQSPIFPLNGTFHFLFLLSSLPASCCCPSFKSQTQETLHQIYS